MHYGYDSNITTAYNVGTLLLLAVTQAVLVAASRFFCCRPRKKGVKKRSPTRAKALSGGLPPRFGGVHKVSIQIASRVGNEVENGHGGDAQQVEWLHGRGGVAWSDGFHRQPGRKGNTRRLGLQRN
jgi:hypothetical protein